jgi:hypothetical protein
VLSGALLTAARSGPWKVNAPGGASTLHDRLPRAA